MWPITTIGNVCVPISQKDPSKSNEGFFRYVDIGSIDRLSKTISSTELVPCSEAPSRARKVLKAEDVLVSMVRPNLNAVARVPTNLDGEIASTGFSVLRAKSHLVNPKFLFYRTQHKDFIDYLVSTCTGQSYPAVSDEIIRSSPLPLPPLSEQERIVEVLDEADRMRKLRQEANQKAERIIPALFHKMFGDPATNPKWWFMSKFEKTLKDCSAGQAKVQTKDFLANGKLSIVDQGQSQIAGYTNKASNSYTGQLPVIVFGDHTRIFKFVDHSFAIGADGVRVLTPQPGIDPFFIFWHCRLLDIPSDGYSRHFKRLKEKIFLCPPLPAQQKFGARAKSVIDSLSSIPDAVSKLEAVFNTLLSHAFSGRLTVRWRESRMKELLCEIEEQARLLKFSDSNMIETLH